jgi:hypothetical protein
LSKRTNFGIPSEINAVWFLRRGDPGSIATGTNAPDGVLGEGIAINAGGNLYTAEARGVTKYVKD